MNGKDPMKIWISSKASVDVIYRGKRARFSGELGISDFKADAYSMRWMEPVRDAPVSEEEREEWVREITSHAENIRSQVYFAEDRDDDLKRAEYHWKRKEFRKAEVLFEKHLDSLSEIQNRKLAYIKKHYTENI